MEEQPDKLTRDNSAEIAAGMSYGQWKAMQPPAPIEPRKPPAVYVEHTCACCGCTFVSYDRKDRKYCDNKCRKRAAYEQEKKRKGIGAK